MRKILAPVLFVFTAAALLAGCKKNTESSLTPVTLNEVAHSIFYAPQYAAIELGYFEEEGIDLTLVNGAGADKVMTAPYPEMRTSGSWDLRRVSILISRAMRITP